MESWLLSGSGTQTIDLPQMMLSLLLAFLAGQVMAWVYILTHSGLSYSRTYVNSLILIPVTVALVMTVLDNNLVTAFSLMAVFAIVRFRNIVRDTLDTVFILTLIVIGMASGTQLYTTAIIGTLLFAAIMLYLRYTHFGSRHRYDYIVNLHWTDAQDQLPLLTQLMNNYSLRVQLASQRSGRADEGIDLSYRLLLRDPTHSHDLLDALKSFPGVTRVTGLEAQDESEA